MCTKVFIFKLGRENTDFFCLTAGLKGPGGTAPVITPTSMVSTWRENMRVLETESTGIIGRSDPACHDDWRYLIFSSLFSGLSLLPQNDGNEDKKYETSRFTRVSEEELNEL